VPNSIEPDPFSDSEMDGHHPGNMIPSQNTDDSDMTQGIFRFDPKVTPWENGTSAKPKPTIPP